MSKLQVRRSQQTFPYRTRRNVSLSAAKRRNHLPNRNQINQEDRLSIRERVGRRVEVKERLEQLHASGGDAGEDQEYVAAGLVIC